MSKAPEGRQQWRHRAGDRYVLIMASLVGGNSTPLTIEHYLGAGEFPTVAAARRAGFRDLGRSDDFNVGAVRGGRLAAMLWMGEVVDDDPVLMAEVAAEIGLR